MSSFPSSLTHTHPPGSRCFPFSCLPCPPSQASGQALTDLHYLFPTVPEAPVIDTQRTFAYDQIFLCWRLPPHSPPAWHYTVEFRRTDVPAQQGPTRWQRREEVRGTSALLENPDTGSVYVLRVRGCNKAGYGEYSEDVHLHTPPAPGE